jgi:hypothetical protein
VVALQLYVHGHAEYQNRLSCLRFTGGVFVRSPGVCKIVQYRLLPNTYVGLCVQFITIFYYFFEFVSSYLFLTFFRLVNDFSILTNVF